MNRSVSKIFTHVADFRGLFAQLSASLFMLFLVVSCAGNGDPLTNPKPKSDDTPTTAAQDYYSYDDSPVPATSQGSERGPGRAIESKGYSFQSPGGDWVQIGGEDGAPLEYYNAQTGRRAVLREVELAEGEPMNLMDRARIELQSFESSGKKANIAETYPEEAFGTTGAFFDIVGKRYDTPYEAVGLVTGSGNRIYTLTLSASDNLPAAGGLKEEWREFFASFELKEIQREEGPELSPEHLQDYTSEALGYRWTVKDTLWHFWNGISKQNNDPDLVLTNKDEDVSFFIYGAIVPADEVSAQDLFKVLLVRLGVDPNEPSLESKRVKVGDRYVQEFTLTHTVNRFDFSYKGRFFYEDGRGILAVA